MSELTDLGILQALQADERLRELSTYVTPLALPAAFGIARNEVAHSNLISTLLNPGLHRGADAMLRTLLKRIAEHHRLDPDIADEVRVVAGAEWKRVEVRREHFRIDVVIKISTAQGLAVIGIENKIDAGEQPRQITRYQEALEISSPNSTALMVFLTPTGRESTTAREDAPVPVVAFGYELVADAVEEARRQSTPGTRDNRVLEEVAAHVREVILGESEVQSLARELWRRHGRALQLALKYRPQLGEIREQYEALLTEVFGGDANFTYFGGSRNDMSEIKLHLSSWHENGFPFTFMLRVGKDRTPYVRLLIWTGSYKEYSATLASWAHRVNAAEGQLIDENFTPLSGWGVWRRVLNEEDYPPEANLKEIGFDEDTARAAADAVIDLYERLRPQVEGA